MNINSILFYQINKDFIHLYLKVYYMYKHLVDINIFLFKEREMLDSNVICAIHLLYKGSAYVMSC